MWRPRPPQAAPSLSCRKATASPSTPANCCGKNRPAPCPVDGPRCALHTRRAGQVRLQRIERQPRRGARRILIRRSRSARKKPPPPPPPPPSSFLSHTAPPPPPPSSLRPFFIAQSRHASRLRQPPAAATGGASARLAALGAQGPLVLVEALLPALVHLLLGLAFRVAGGIRPEPPRCGERKRHQHPPPGHCSERSDLEILQCQ